MLYKERGWRRKLHFSPKKPPTFHIIDESMTAPSSPSQERTRSSQSSKPPRRIPPRRSAAHSSLLTHTQPRRKHPSPRPYNCRGLRRRGVRVSRTARRSVQVSRTARRGVQVSRRAVVAAGRRLARGTPAVSAPSIPGATPPTAPGDARRRGARKVTLQRAAVLAASPARPSCPAHYKTGGGGVLGAPIHRATRRYIESGGELLASMAGGMATYYEVLGVAQNASAAEIRSAWRKLSLKWHPDKRADDDAVSQERALARYLETQEAYAVLSDRERKAMYDARLRMQGRFDASTQNGADKEGHGSNEDVMTAMKDGKKSDGEDSDDGQPRRPAAAGGPWKPWKKKGNPSPSSPATVRIDVSVKFTPAAGTSRGGGPSGPRRPACPRKTMLNPVLRKLRGRKDD